jgi:hypothetical protein
MKDFRFYEVYKNKRKGITEGNVIAVIPENKWIDQDRTGKAQLMYDSIGAVYFRPNSPVCGSGVSQDYLWAMCKRISESKAREIHPALFQYLDQN